MNAKELYEVLSQKNWKIKDLRNAGILSSVIELFPEILIKHLEKDPDELCDLYLGDEFNNELFVKYPEFVAAGIRGGYNDIIFIHQQNVLDNKIVTETVLLTLCDENNNVYYMPPSFVMKNLETIRLIIKMGNYNLLRNLPNATFYLFLDEIATCVNDYKAYDLLESLSGDFFIEHEDLFFKILRDETIPYIDPNVMNYYAPSLPKDVLSYKNFYSCRMFGVSAFSIYFEYNEKKVEEYFCNYYPFTDRKVDLSFKYGLTHDMIRKIYSYFKIFVERHCKDDEVNKEYFNFIHWTFHADWLKGVPDVVEDICFNSHLALAYYGKNVSSPEMILKIIKRNPEDIIYLEEIFLSKVEITKEALDSI